jgi:hypothetical protein
MSHWTLGLSSWIIQDGNYGDFEKGQHTRFAVEFYLPEFSLSSVATRSVSAIEAARYQVNADVTLQKERVWILNLGDISVFQDIKPPGNIHVGQFVQGDIWLGVDPFSYFESLSEMPGIPPLIYEWQIEQIEIQTAPFIESVDERGGKVFTRNETKLGYRPIERTNAWSDDGGHAEYILRCRRMDSAPTAKI